VIELKTNISTTVDSRLKQITDDFSGVRKQTLVYNEFISLVAGLAKINTQNEQTAMCPTNEYIHIGEVAY